MEIQRSKNQDTLFLDQSAYLDRSLEVLAALCLGTGPEAQIAPETIQGIGEAIESYLHRRAVLESRVSGRFIDQLPIAASDLSAENARLRCLRREA